ncbi:MULTISPECIES: amidohydrolase family protein [unclassified Bradyrhizobium]|uniref:amidohydrolase family protein n=1 Tax=unclassified Bradyrhizobium TaxID=2631580 RepID=UPI000403E779|nr:MULTISPECIES: amidohydrolase family protein [unclassified Bradyrhizobium]QIG98371.1 amidohydrolase family protein [Bradyrhizobium sp. 6(2017)]
MDVTATRLFSGPDRGTRDNVVLRHDGGVITDISEATSPATGPRSLILPAFVNAHDHARPRASAFGAVGMPLESWILRTVVGTPVDPCFAAASALARAAQAGCAAMMVHYTRPSGIMPLLDETRAIARAAGDVGIRIGFAIAVRDQNPIVYGDSEPVLASLASDDRKTIEELFVRAPMSPKAYIELTDAIAAAIGGPKVDVQLGPAGVQWCSKPLLEAVADNSAHTGRRIHMHLLETIYQRAWADQHFPGGIVRYLRDIGFLSGRLTLAHCIHARPDEIEMIAASGARIVTNYSSNLHLRSGLAPIAAAHACGCAIAVGVDGLALDEDDDVLRETRLVQMMQGGLGFQRTWTAQDFFALAIGNGRRVTGAPADFVRIDLDRLEGDQILPADPIDLLFARGNASLVRDVVVNGRTIVSNGRCVGVDLPAIEQELRGLYRASAATYAHVLGAWPRLSVSLQDWFETQLTCN